MVPSLVARGHAHSALLDALRVVASARPEFGGQVADAALAVLRGSSSVPAGRCVADLVAHVTPTKADDAVCRSMVVLAGAPQGDGGFVRSRRVNDPVGLLAIADLVPNQLEAVLRAMMPGPPPAPALMLPPGSAGRHEESMFEIGSAAGAVRVLSGTHPELAAKLVAPMVLQLSSTVFDRFDSEGLADIERALAVMLVSDVGDVPTAIVAAGTSGSDELGERLVRMLSLAGDLVSGDPRWREPGTQRQLRTAGAVADELLSLRWDA